MTQLLRVHNFFVSRDGFGAGEGQSLERPFGHADPVALGAWAIATDGWPNRTEPGGSLGLDDYMILDFHRNIGAEIMGRNKFGPQRGAWEDHEWKGWWGTTSFSTGITATASPAPAGSPTSSSGAANSDTTGARSGKAPSGTVGPPPARGV